MPEGAYKNRILNMSWVLNMLNSEYGKVLNMAGFSICKHYAAFWIYQNMSWQSSEYILGSKYDFDRVLNMQELYRVLNMSQYGWIYLNKKWICLNMSEFMIIERVLNIYYTIHSKRSLYKVMSIYWKIGLFRTWSKI